MARSLETLQKQYKSNAPQKGGPGHGGPMGPGPRRGPGGRGPGGKPKNMKTTIGRLLKYLAAYKFHLITVLFTMLASTVTSLMGKMRKKLRTNSKSLVIVWISLTLEDQMNHIFM